MKPNAPKEGKGFHNGRKTPKPEKVRTLSLEKDDGTRKKAINAQIDSNKPGILPKK